MGWFASTSVVVLSGALGLVVAGFVAAACVEWYRISGFEGKSGYFIVFAALGGGVVSFVLGLVAARVGAAMAAPGFFKALGLSFAVILACGGAVALVAWLRADIAPEIDGAELNLEIELRLPAGESTPPTALAGHASFTLGSSVNHVQRASHTGELKVAEARLENGRWIIPASVFLFTTRGLRSIDVQLGGKSVGGFIVPLPGRPGREFLQWSDWGPRGSSADQPRPDTESSYRFRVARIVRAPAAPTPEELQLQEEEKVQAAFEAVPPDAPISAWFAYTRNGAPPERRGIAIRNITEKTDYAAELGALMVADDAQAAAEAMYLVEHLPRPPAALLGSVAAAGRQIAALMRKVNAATLEQDPGFLGAADVSIRFSAWLSAARTLREGSGGDFVPELRAILELSRMRTDSYVMQQDVRRVASFYLNQWAGIAPLPGDPPPK